MIGSLSLELAVVRARRLAATPGRSLLGIVGAPGSGKSTLAAAVAASVPGAVVVPMDGFHLPTAALMSAGGAGGAGAGGGGGSGGAGSAGGAVGGGGGGTGAAGGAVARRGAPDTFDAAGYVALLRVVRGGSSVLAPDFDRALEEPVADVIAVPASAALVITEGNYLLLDSAPWSAIPQLLDETWFVDVPEPVRVERLVARFVSYGWDPRVALNRVLHGTDASNAALVAATRARADAVISLA